MIRTREQKINFYKELLKNYKKDNKGAEKRECDITGFCYSMPPFMYICDFKEIMNYKPKFVDGYWWHGIYGYRKRIKILKEIINNLENKKS